MLQGHLAPPVSELPIHGGMRAVIRRYRQTGGVIDTEPTAESILAVHLEGRDVLERRYDRGGWDRTTLDRGLVTLLPAGRRSSWRLHGAMEFIHLAVPKAALDELVRNEGLTSAGRKLDWTSRIGLDDAFIAGAVLGIEEQLRAPRPLSRLYVETCLRLVVVHTLQRFAEPPMVLTADGVLPCPAVRRVLEAIEARLADDWSLDALAAVAGLPTWTFARAFRRALGEPPHRFLVRRRVEAAKALLRRTELPVIEVAARTGFESPQHFARVFRRYVGATPSEYRRL